MSAIIPRVGSKFLEVETNPIDPSSPPTPTFTAIGMNPTAATSAPIRQPTSVTSAHPACSSIVAFGLATDDAIAVATRDLEDRCVADARQLCTNRFSLQIRAREHVVGLGAGQERRETAHRPQIDAVGRKEREPPSLFRGIALENGQRVVGRAVVPHDQAHTPVGGGPLKRTATSWTRGNSSGGKRASFEGMRKPVSASLLILAARHSGFMFSVS